MKAGNWIDKVKTEMKLPSDYAVAKMLGLSRFTVSGYRQRPDATLDEDIAIKVAEVLHLNPAGIVLDQVAERSKNDVVRSTLSAEAARLCILCKVAVATVLIAAGARPMRPVA